MPAQYFDCVQGSPGWYSLRLGIPTASEFATVLAKGKDGGPSLTRRKYLHQLAAEIITGEASESYTNAHMERGRAQEAEARYAYAEIAGAEPDLIGFVRNGDAGASPDALLGDSGLLEIKTRAPHLQVELLLADKFPPEHRAQIQGALWVSEREWCDLAVYSPGLPLFISRQYRDETYIAELAAAVDRFNAELHEIAERLRRYGTPLTSLLEQSLTIIAEAQT